MPLTPLPILVHRKQLLAQWQERLSEFLTINEVLPEEPKKKGRKRQRTLIGSFGAGKDARSGIVDVAIMQSMGSADDIKPFIKEYVNEFHFSKVLCRECEERGLQACIEETKKVYLRADYRISQRPSGKDEMKFLDSLLRGQGVKYNKGKRIQGEHNDTIEYDYLTDKYGIKLFSFRNKDISRVMNSVKAWAWNSEHSPENFETIFIYSTDPTHDEKDKMLLSSILSILQSASRQVYKIDNSDALIEKLTKDST